MVIKTQKKKKKKITSMETKTYMKACYGNKVRIIPA